MMFITIPTIPGKYLVTPTIAVVPTLNTLIIIFLLISQTFANSILQSKLLLNDQQQQKHRSTLLTTRSDSNDGENSGSPPLSSTSAAKPFQINIPSFLLKKDKLESRSSSGFSSITAFITDPALLVTILHSLEVAYWTLPFGIILKPIINIFRVPNRRMDHDDGTLWMDHGASQQIINNHQPIFLKTLNRIRRQTNLNKS